MVLYILFISLIHKACNAGHAFQLPDWPTIPEWMLRGWKNNFVATLDPKELQKIKYFR